MSALDALRDSPFAYHLGWTLLHFLWQGALVGAVYACLRNYMADASPQSRYLLSLGTLALLALLPVVTLIYVMGMPQAVPVITGFAAGNHVFIPPQQPTLLDSLHTLLHPLVPWTVPAWSVGVALLGFKSLAGWRRARLLTRQASHAAPDAWQETVTRLALQFGVRVQVRLLVTARVTVPCVIGWLKPVILLPPMALTGLTALQLEMVLAHELSHIRRHDYLINLLQVAVETLLFYHPVVRWISRDARRERELCCDDSAVHACGDALHYAHALTDLAALRSGDVSPAMGVTGGDLAMRVERLITPHHAPGAPRITSVMLATTLCFGGLLAMASARHMPMPVFQASSLLQSASIVTSEILYRSRIAPTELNMAAPELQRTASLPQAQAMQPQAVDTVAVPPAPQPTAPSQTAPALHAPVHIGGQPLSSLLAAPDGNSGLAANKRAMAQIKFISMNPNGDTAAGKGSHEYCEPITGSRVCN
ncbi:MAG TPA: M56 family metallopeptidase [Gammaproteobacteria bacterium]|jgi:beta-lactamase regulating signal transducer with metallopeptidase domain